MPGNARTHQTISVQCFCVECGTSEHSALLPMPSAESTVNVNQGRRLRAPKKPTDISGPEQPGGVLVEMPAPASVVSDDWETF